MDKEKDFVPYDLALRLKKLGFDEPCMGVFELIVVGDTIPKFRYNFYKSEAEVSSEGRWHNHNENDLDWKWSAPLLQQAFRWLRDRYRLDCAVIKHIGYKSKPYTLDITRNDKDTILDYDNDEDIVTYITFEEAELAALKKLIEVLGK
jgi:hypothetical protein